MVESIIDGLKNYFDACPIIQEMDGKLKVDFIKDDTRSFSIEPVPGEAVLEQYMDRVSDRQYRFNLTVKFPYSDEARMNIENNMFFERLGKWVEENSEEGNLPELPSIDTAEELNITSTGYLFSVTPNMRIGRYQMSMQLVYLEDRR